MDIPSGRDRLKTTTAKLDKVRQENKDLKTTISELRAELNKAQGENSELQNERTRLSNSIEDLKITAANPLALSRKNKELQRDLDQARADASALEKDNHKLRNNVMQEWFIIGAAVSIGSLILGIILTRIRWKKRDSWSDSF
jgi:SH3 domain protein